MSGWTGPIPKGARVQGIDGDPGSSPLEIRFLDLWERCGGPELVREYIFHPARKYAIDFAHMASKTGFEIQGGIYGKGGHSSTSGLMRDSEKSIIAWSVGWRIIPVTSDKLTRKWVTVLVAVLKEV